ncbi:MAG: phenylalanine--tRNA ligase subunit beta, partial [Chlorobiales bacterium]|nr:phenylalanine--tRNA ligase subunit beta [Chlorobiales bacterium]
PRYIAVIIEGVTIAPSPAWLQEKLKTIGLRPISNIVDITNYVLHSVGQPLHAFDLDKLSGKQIRVRSNINGKFKTLDEKEREIEPGMVMICDAEKPVAVGGVMGGLDSEISDSTKNVLLESAYFNPSSIRRTAKKLGLSSDAAYRFERGVDPAGIELAAAIATQMILDLAGGTVTEMSIAEAEPVTKKTVSFRPERANAVLGTNIEPDQMVSFLTRLGFEKSSEENGAIRFSVPTYRVDVDQEIDLIEDVARVYGYDNIAASPKMVSAYPATRNRHENFDERIRQLMLGFNYKELLTNPLLKQSEVEPFSERIVRTLNPISEEMEALRPSLVPSLLKVISRNLNLGNADQRLFEIGHTFELAGEGKGESVPGYAEREVLCFALTGSREPKGWNQGKSDVDFYDLKGTVEALLHKLRILEKSKFIVYNPSCLQLEITRVAGHGTIQNNIAGRLWIVSQELLARFDIAQPVFIAELELAKLKAFSEFERTYQEPAKFPVVHRDLAFLISKDVYAQDIVEEILRSDKLIEQVDIFDIFEGNAKDATFSSKRSIAFSLSLVSRERTLTDKEIHALSDKVIERIKTKFGAELRQA